MVERLEAGTRPDERAVAGGRRGGGRPNRQKRANRLAALILIGPNAVAYLLFIVVPAVTGAALGFFSWDLFTTPRWVGLTNYRQLLHDPMVASSLGHSLEFVVLGVVPTMLIGFMFAVLVNSQLRGMGPLRVLYFLPLVISTAVAGVLWSAMFSPDTGLVNRVLSLVGINGPAWLANTTWALPALTVVIIWLSLPLVIILYLAGLQRVPAQMYEAAQLDGAGPWVRLWAITWPAVASTTALVVVLEVLQYLGAPFEVALIMTDGGPLNVTTSMSLYAYKVAFQQSNIGYAAALSMLQFLVLLVLVGISWVVVRRRRRRQGVTR